jgi:1-acyl-sn-glycerol-3-phosphate acyltransferase
MPKRNTQTAENIHKKTSAMFRIIKWCIRVGYPRIQVEGIENLPEEPVIFVGNHCQMNGPIVGELYVPGQPYIWCAGEMMKLKTVPEYAFRDFWSQKPRWTHPFYRLLSYIIAPLAVCLFNNARTISVYHDVRILSTFKDTVKKLQEGKSIVIFPEHDEKYNHIIYDFQGKFIDIARLYYKKTGKELDFVPMYITPKLKKLCLGKPIRFCGEAAIDTERERIRKGLMEEITALAQALPEHTVVPYRNIPKKDYPSNILK